MDDNTASARINQYERGKHMPDYLTLKRMADELEVPVSFFFCEDDLSAQLVCLFNGLSGNQKDMILSVMREILKK